MSEGWLTESALLPKAPVPISGVSDRTFKQLKTALVESKLRPSSVVSVDTVKGSALPTVAASKPKRRRKEESEEENREQKLAKKSLLYQDLVEGKRSRESVVAELDSQAKKEVTSKLPAKVTSDDLLIDFDLKQKLEGLPENPSPPPQNSKLAALRAQLKK
eukprot:Protomagalhaensia_sp_Gyna_25__3191@NODE_290_length_4034_cov_181_182979_g224_i0_p4_GENE_NODE_290_length_4034_cov_181_182979_g224_i0NODE_290_length_4034_cov_181_182979_g224_i0_p4_ORF_typecomplete_len161_score29_44MRPS35/PF10246_9/8_9e03MRPS35/PF10246_9/0_21_NODE_290_length_4034_cov_181_182979_g224_i022752757